MPRDDRMLRRFRAPAGLATSHRNSPHRGSEPAAFAAAIARDGCVAGVARTIGISARASH